VNTAFKHLEAKLRFGELSVGQWAGVLAGVLFGLVFAQYLSPVRGLWGAVIGVYLGAVPASAAFFASLSEFDLWGLLGAAARWRRNPGRYLPGPGTRAHGYCLTEETGADYAVLTDRLQLDGFWELAAPVAAGAE